MTLTWSPALETGHAQIDSHHRRLFGYVGDLEALCRSYDPAKAAILLQFLDLYIQQHFSYEEICMERLHCPAAGENKAAHEQFRRAYAEFRRRYKESGGDYRMFSELKAMVEMWLSSHVARVDANLKPCLKRGN